MWSCCCVVCCGRMMDDVVGIWNLVTPDIGVRSMCLFLRSGGICCICNMVTGFTGTTIPQ